MYFKLFKLEFFMRELFNIYCIEGNERMVDNNSDDEYEKGFADPNVLILFS